MITRTLVLAALAGPGLIACGDDAPVRVLLADIAIGRLDLRTH